MTRHAGTSRAWQRVLQRRERYRHRDSVVINLGLSQRADERASAEWRSELLHRVLLSPRTAKHLHRILAACSANTKRSAASSVERMSLALERAHGVPAKPEFLVWTSSSPRWSARAR